MIRLNQAHLQLGGKILLQNADLTIHHGQKVGIVGRNGCGKSSLFRLISGKLTTDQGDCDTPSDWLITEVKQETPSVDEAAIDYVLQGHQQLVQFTQGLHKAEQEQDGQKIAFYHEQLDTIHAHRIEADAYKVLNGLGFSESDGKKSVKSFSGGWRMRLNLAQALICPSDLLLLDEPTNHLDLDAVMWLESWLKRFPATLILISHDRDFLDGTVDYIAQLKNGHIDMYKGGYSDYEHAYAEKLALDQARATKEEKKREELNRFITRFKAKASKAKQAQSRVKVLEKMGNAIHVAMESPFQFRFQAPDALPNPLLRLDEAEVGYEDHPALLSEITLNIRPGDRFGLLGRNGAGKSTLIKLLAEQLSLRGGELFTAKQTRIGYFAQHQMDFLREEWSPLAHIQALSPQESEQSLRDYLGGYDFRGDKATDPIKAFSGGEKARLALALLVWQNPNLLLLDEPTNHLDLDMRQAIILALQNFTGACVIVSHDRYLLNSCCQEFLLVDAGNVIEWDGTIADYHRWLSQPAQNPSKDTESVVSPQAALSRKDIKKIEAQLRQHTAPIRKKIKNAENQLQTLDEKINAIDALLGDAEAYAQLAQEALTAKLHERGQFLSEKEQIEEDWLMLNDELEQIIQEQTINNH
ncbi:MAG: ATP-binding cassette domain-containing protein [Pseudomonadota bacterium]